MILPIVPYGDPVLREETVDIEENSQISELVSNLYETMYHANGVGLAAPQIGKAIRLFVLDTEPFSELEEVTDPKEVEELANFKKTFINPIIVEEKGKKWAFEEGCLSIPGINADVSRPDTIVIEYYNEKWELVEEEYNGLIARVIQHEYDHIEGVLFTDLVSPLKKKFLTKKLLKITAGDVSTSYKMKFLKRRR
jgi:peptide deformylase